MDTKKEIEITSLAFTKTASWASENPNRWTARVEFKGNGNSISVVLAPEVAESLLITCAPFIAQFSAKAAEEITREVLEEAHKLKALNAPPAVDTPANPEPVIVPACDIPA